MKEREGRVGKQRRDAKIESMNKGEEKGEKWREGNLAPTVISKSRRLCLQLQRSFV